MKKGLCALLAALMLLAAIGCANMPAPTEAPAENTAEAQVENPTEAPASEPAAPDPKPDTPQNETFAFTDSAGRTLEIPTNLERVAISGPLAQIAVFALCPDKLVGIAQKWDKSAEKFLATEYYNLPELGQLYGGKGELNLETLLQSGAQVVIDVGEPKGTIKEDLDALTEQTGIPFVHITATIATMGDAYRKLGELMNMPDEAEALAAYCDETYAKVLAAANGVEKVRLLYITGDQGLNVIAKGSYHAEIIDLLSDNLAVVDSPSSKGTGNEVDMEQIMLWNPDVILFAPGSCYASVGTDPMWSEITAIKTGNYYEVPMGPYNWMGFPPSVQRILGMLWMAKLLYPDAADYDLKAEVKTYFNLFYHCDLSDADYDMLVANSIGARETLAPAA
jgi:iron complex transport system substrate-binding protein